MPYIELSLQKKDKILSPKAVHISLIRYNNFQSELALWRSESEVSILWMDEQGA